MKREWNIRVVYLYLVSFVTLIMLIVGGVQLIQSVVEIAYPPPVYVPKLYPPEAPDRSGKIDAEVWEKQRLLEEAQQKQQIRYDRARRLAGSLSLLVVAFPIYLYHWRRIQNESHGEEKG